MTLVKAQIDASVAVLGRHGIGAANPGQIIQEIYDAIKANAPAPDNTLPEAPVTPGNELPGGPPPTAGTPLPGTPVFPDAGLPSPPTGPDNSLPVGPPPVNPNPNPDPDFDVDVPGRPDNTLPNTPTTKPSEPTGKPGHELPEHAAPKKK